MQNDEPTSVPSAETIWRDAYVAVYGCEPSHPPADYRAAYEVIERGILAALESRPAPTEEIMALHDALEVGMNRKPGQCDAWVKPTPPERVRVLEEAARVADRYREEAGGSRSYRQACEHIASTIRALSASPTEGVEEALKFAGISARK